jgi:hypothetical protein
MHPRYRIVIALIALLLVAGGAYAYLESMDGSVPDPAPMATSTAASGEATTTPPAQEDEAEDITPVATASDHGYGTATLKLNEAASFPDGLSIRVTEVVEDSRCPANANCIQAGTVRISVRTRSAMGVSTNIFKPGSVLTTEVHKITLVSVAPQTMAGRRIADNDYRFTFKVEKRTAATNPGTTGGCYIGGCSAQLCTDNPGAASDCAYRPEYACYKTAKCERQSNGQCGWTQTSELAACLSNPPALN